MEIIIATDASWVVDDITAALGADGVNFTVCSEGRVVADEVGSMGGMAVTMSLRLDESSGLLPHVPVLMLLDRRADLHLARRSGAEGWLIKPLDSLRLKRAVTAINGGGTYTEGLPAPDPVAADDVDVDPDVAESPEEEAVNAG